MTSLLSINVNEHTEKKANLTYLSWAWAWAEVLKVDPKATWKVNLYGPQGCESPCMWIGETAMVHATVTINDIARDCMLPVMDHRNKAIPKPDAFAVNTAIMRCMTKAISMHGLGLYIYAGEDLPQVTSEADEKAAQAAAKRQAELDELALYFIDCDAQETHMPAIKRWYDEATWSADSDVANEEKMYVWGLLKQQSKLRSAIKANRPTIGNLPATTEPA